MSQVNPRINDDVYGKRLSPKSLDVLETMVWGAVCMPNAREKVFSMNTDMFSDDLRRKIESLKKSLQKNKVDKRIDEWFTDHKVNIKEASNVMDAIEVVLDRELERKTLHDFCGLMRSAAQIGEKPELVKIMKECLRKLGEM
jgi:hypothetical protein